MRLFPRRTPNVASLMRRRDVVGLLRAAKYGDVVADREGRPFDVGVNVRRQALAALRDVCGAMGAGAAIEALDDGAPEVRLEALRTLTLHPEPAAAEPLVVAVVNWPDPPYGDGRVAARAALAELADPALAGKLAKALIYGSPSETLDGEDERLVKALLGDELYGAAGSDVVEAAVAGLVSERQGVRRRSEQVLVWLRARSVEPLVTALQEEPAREGAASVLGAIKDLRAAPALVELLHDVDPKARSAAALALGEIKEPRAAAALLAASADPEHAVREAALAALDKLGAAGIVSGVATAIRPLLAPHRQHLIPESTGPENGDQPRVVDGEAGRRGAGWPRGAARGY